MGEDTEKEEVMEDENGWLYYVIDGEKYYS